MKTNNGWRKGILNNYNRPLNEVLLNTATLPPVKLFYG